MFQKGKCGVVYRQLCVQCVTEGGQQSVEGGAAALEEGHEGVAVAAGGVLQRSREAMPWMLQKSREGMRCGMCGVWQ